VDRRKEYTRVPLWVRSSPGDRDREHERDRERPSGPRAYRPQSFWPQSPNERQERSERPERRDRSERPPRQPRTESRPRGRRMPLQRTRPPRHETVPTERITLRNPVHLADWERRTEIVEDAAELISRTQESGKAPWIIQVWKIGDEYILARGFAALAAAVDAGLPEVRVVVAARFPRWELLWVDPKTIQGTDPLLSRAMEARKKVKSVGWVFPPLAATVDPSGSYTLGRGKRGTARLWAAQEEGLALVPIVARPTPRRSVVAGTVQVEVAKVHVTMTRHLRKMSKPLPMRLMNEVSTGRLRPIRVRRTVDGNYELVDGLLRLRAAQEVGLRMINAIIEVDMPKGKEKEEEEEKEEGQE